MKICFEVHMGGAAIIHTILPVYMLMTHHFPDLSTSKITRIADVGFLRGVHRLSKGWWVRKVWWGW